MHYSIWVMPDKKVKNKSSSIISNLSRKYKFPEFSPHVTLIAPLNDTEEILIKKASCLLTSAKPFKISLSGLRHDNKFFKCIFVNAGKNSDMMNLNKEAQKIFFIRKKFEPHLSLMYGIFPAKVRKNIIKDLEAFSGSFTAKDIYLMRIEGREPKDWHIVKKFTLGKL